MNFDTRRVKKFIRQSRDAIYPMSRDILVQGKTKLTKGDRYLQY